MIETTAISRARPPDLIPGYKLEKLVGKGGMGEVHKATQLSLGRTVAVKLLAAELASDKAFVVRFEKEAAALATLSHPHIVAIVDKGKSKETYFLVMEFVDGPSLREMMRSPLLDTPGALKIGMEICRAIDYAHGRGVIHRDLKPENILLDEQAGGIPKVSDFGLASFVDQDAPSKFNLTETHISMGTLSYMAPEQRVDAKNADHRADIYSLGVILYELLVGEVPMGNFDPPSQRKPDVDKRLDAIIARCLKPDPAERYQTVADLILDLEPFAPMNFSQRPRKVGKVERAKLAVQQAVRTAIKVAAVTLVLAAALVIGVAALRSKTDGPARVSIGEALTTSLEGNPAFPSPARRTSEGDGEQVTLGEGPDSVPLASAGRSLVLDGKAFSFEPSTRRMPVGRATLDLPDLEGTGAQWVSEVSVPEPPSGVFASLRNLVTGTTPDPRSALALTGTVGHYAALTLSGNGDPITFQWALLDQHLTVLGPPSPREGTVRLELTIDKGGDLRAFVGAGKDRRAIGGPVELGPGWKKRFGKPPAPMLACVEGACQFRKPTWEVTREASPPPTPPPPTPAPPPKPTATKATPGTKTASAKTPTSTRKAATAKKAKAATKKSTPKRR
jgi:eukaryotic-like serine/threonine-protein kinase